MNKSLPVGSIYVTTDITSVTDMQNKYGGTWERWGEGRVPVGADITGGDARFAPGVAAGKTDETTVIDPFALGGIPVVGEVILTDGEVKFNDNSGVAQLDTEGKIELSGSETIKGDLQLDETNTPAHNHDAFFWVQHKTHGEAGTIACSGGYRYMDTGQSGNTSYSSGWNVTMADAGSGEAIPVVMTTALDIGKSPYGATLTTTLGQVNNPAITKYTPQKIDATKTSLSTVASNGTATWTDKTVQEYVTVYMYKRTGLALLAS